MLLIFGKETLRGRNHVFDLLMKYKQTVTLSAGDFLWGGGGMVIIISTPPHKKNIYIFFKCQREFYLASKKT